MKVRNSSARMLLNLAFLRLQVTGFKLQGSHPYSGRGWKLIYQLPIVVRSVNWSSGGGIFLSSLPIGVSNSSNLEFKKNWYDI